MLVPSTSNDHHVTGGSIAEAVPGPCGAACFAVGVRTMAPQRVPAMSSSPPPAGDGAAIGSRHSMHGASAGIINKNSLLP